MRISTSIQFANGTYALDLQQNRLSQLQSQLSTMQRVNVPSDDPVASAQILNTTQAQAVAKQFTTNTQAVQNQLALSDSTLTQVSDLISTMKTLAVQAGGGGMSTSNLQSIQTQFQEQVQQLVGLMNTQDNNGNYMFSGTRASTQPYTLNISSTSISINYQGDSGQTSVQVSASRSLAVSDPGSAVFGTSSTMSAPPLMTNGNELLQAVSLFNQALSMGQSNPNFKTYLSNALNGFDKGQQSVLTSLAQVGSRESEASTLEQLGKAQDVNYAKTLSDLQGLDVAKAVSDFQQAMSAMQASQKTFQQVTSLSLFNYIQ